MQPDGRISRGYVLAKRGLSDEDVMRRARIGLAEIVLIRGIIAAEPSAWVQGVRLMRA
jgi:hypothetical protein